MNPFILYAKNKNELSSISKVLLDKKFKVLESESHYILMKKRRYGNYFVHIFSLFIALFFFYPMILINLVYFTYSYLWASPYVLITTETHSEDGNDLKFNSLDEIFKKSEAIL